MRLTYGKYKGEDVEDIPESYLEWIEKDKADELNELQQAMERRGLSTNRPRPKTTVKTVVQETTKVTPLQLEMMELGYKKLALARHPDRGGNTRDMQLLNDAITKARKPVTEKPKPKPSDDWDDEFDDE
jgi:hypothetical protein